MKTRRKRIKKIMKQNIMKAMKEKGLLNPIDAVIKPSFTKEILKYLDPGKLKPLAIDPYNGTK